MKPTVAVDEMFPEGAGGQFMDLEEVKNLIFVFIYFFFLNNFFYLGRWFSRTFNGSSGK